MRKALWLCCLGVALLAACSDDKAIKVTPEIAIEPVQIDFGAVHQNDGAESRVFVHSKTLAALTLNSVTVEDDADAPGGATAFKVTDAPTTLDGQTDGTISVRFTPPEVKEYAANLVVKSDDPNRGEIHVALKGHGAVPVLKVVAECKAPCKDFAVTETPLAIDFGLRPVLRKGTDGRYINEPAWPTVTLLNDGEIPLRIIKIAFEGDMAFQTKASLDFGTDVTIDQGGGQVLPVMFLPEAGKASYVGSLVIQTDDPMTPEVRVKLTGQLAPNQAPTACAAIVEVDQPDGSVDFPKDANGMRSFGAAVAVQPGDKGKVFLSAFSDHFKFNHANGLANPPELTMGDMGACTFDPEDGRANLTFKWTVLQRPALSNPNVSRITGDTNSECSFKPDAIGHYKLQLDVKDAQGLAAKPVTVEFDAIPLRDLVVQLTWEGQPSIDLDVHLVRPAKNCAPKSDCVFDRNGDINGYMNARTGGVFDWGNPAQGDDNPRLDFDDQGDKGLLESVSLNHPENDPECLHSRCTYDVYVHYYTDRRSTSGSGAKCPGITTTTSCKEGEECGCSGIQNADPDSVCVSARCVTQVWPTVKVYVKPTPMKPDPVLTLPLLTGTPPMGEKLPIPGPCFMWKVATISWPSQDELATNPNATATVTEAGRANVRDYSFWGELPTNSYACKPNSSVDPTDPDLTFVPGTIPTYK